MSLILADRPLEDGHRYFQRFPAAPRTGGGDPGPEPQIHAELEQRRAQKII